MVATEEGVRKTVLDNGLRVLTREVPTAHSVSVGLWVNAGSASEPTDRAGLSHFIEHLLFKGTTSRTAQEIAMAIEQVGGALNAFTGREQTCFYIRVLHTDLPLALDILADIFHNPLFDAGEMEKERGVILQEIKMVEDTPDDLVFDLLHSDLWGDTSFGMPIAGTAGTVECIRRENVVDFYRSFYHPERVLLAVAGRLDADQVMRQASRLFSKPVNGKAVDSAENAMPAYTRSRKTHERNLEQVHLCLAFPAFPELDSRRFALSLLNTYLGGGMSSQLFQEVREKRGLAYSVYAFASLYRKVGYVGIYAGVGREGLKECLSVTRAEVEKLRSGGIDTKAVERTKSQIKGQLLLGMESTFNLMQKLAKDEFLFGRTVPLEEIVSQIDKVSIDDLLALAGEIYSEKSLSLTLLGPAPPPESLLV